ncbi:MAG: hypothetical protein O8C63_02490 [Candidatus Methanoperedens sp.]|nr:hypothetical protein [Candidatus Methanoperedens sp.]
MDNIYRKITFRIAVVLTLAILLGVSGAGKKDAWLIKTDANGDEQWDKTFGGKGDDAATSVRQTSDGGFILAGLTTFYKSDMPYSYALLIKTYADGNEQWNRTFGGTYGDVAYFVQQTIDGGYILAGNTKSYGSGISDAWLIKIGGAPVETNKAPTGIPTQILTGVQTGTHMVSPTEKAAGFEVFMAVTTLLVVLIIRRNRRK